MTSVHPKQYVASVVVYRLVIFGYLWNWEIWEHLEEPQTAVTKPEHSHTHMHTNIGGACTIVWHIHVAWVGTKLGMACWPRKQNQVQLDAISKPGLNPLLTRLDCGWWFLVRARKFFKGFMDGKDRERKD